MHVGKSIEGNIKASNIECVFFYTKIIWQQDLILWRMKISIDWGKYRRKEKKEEMEDIQYDQLEETQKVDLVNGLVTFTKHFKYFGTIWDMVSILNLV